VASQKEEELEGLKFLLAEAVSPNGTGTGKYVVAVDAVGSGLGDVVMYASGSSARQTKVTENRPVDATVMAIVDLVEENGALAYRKDGDG